jgi:cytochrome c oxidase subunit III
MTDTALREPWEEVERQREAATFGIWVFLASEILFFSGLLLGYAAYRWLYPQIFTEAARETNIWYGTINTAVLLTSSLTMAVGARGADAGLRRLAAWCFAATAGFGCVFLLIKGFEYHEDVLKRLVPGPDFRLAQPAAQIFFALYWVMTGVHAIHLTIGIGIVTRLFLVVRRAELPVASPQIEVAALYWHLIDVIWIVLYPLLYLVGRS